MKSISVRMRIYVDAELTVGPGRIELLERIQHCGSLAAAAREMGMSYRRAWLLMHSLNSGLRSPALISVKGGHNGGGASVTAVGRSLVKAYRQTEAECQRRVQSRFGPFVRA